MMKISRTYFVILLIFSILFHSSAQDTIFFENFDSSPDSKPEGWTTALEAGSSKWQFVNGGGTKKPLLLGSRKPPNAYSDTVNALYFYESLGGEEVFLITPPINLEFAVKPELRFMHAQREGDLGFGDAHDELRVYYKTHFDSSWVESKKLSEYLDQVFDWTEQTILLPEDAFVPECYFGFRAKTNYGWGVCIDDVSVIETGVQQRKVDTITIHQASTNLLPTGTKHNAVLRIEISVKGNTGNVTLNSIDVSSLNTLDSDLVTDGVGLYYHYGRKNPFAAEAIDVASFASGEASFSLLNLDLPTGNNYLWITYDIKQDAVHGNLADAMIKAGDIIISSIGYPESDASPTGNRLIQESVFTDDFDTDKGWILGGDFQRNRPAGKGGNFLGNPDPLYAAGDTMIIGNDLKGLGDNEGDYEKEVPRYGNLATSPTMDLYYYNDVRLNYLRWLNVANNDTASIELSLDNGSTWSEIWSNNNNVFQDGDWNFISQVVGQTERESQVKFRFNLGPTTTYDHFSGWNIENFAVTGNYVEFDVGPTALLGPASGCGLTSETVSIRVENFGPDATPDKIPVRYSFDGGTTFSEDTLSTAIIFEGETVFDFSEKVDISTPGVYNVKIETVLGVDEEPSNNSFDTVLYVDPAYTLPYVQDFESGPDFWRVEGNACFEYGDPGGAIIHTAASGLNAWVTNLDGSYLGSEDGYLLGPCFDFTGIQYPVFDCMMYVNCESGDGLNLEYSLNNGLSWSVAGNLGDGDSYDWNWYNSEIITALQGEDGWTGESGDWQQARILLDTTIFRNIPNVKFRFHFASDASGVLEGIGIDDVKIYDAPRDLGIESIGFPITGCAQDIGNNVEVMIRNHGLDILPAGDTIILGYDFDLDPTEIDTVVLASDLLRNGTMPYTFKKSLAVSTSGFKDIKAFTLLPDDIDFYNEILTNDTSQKTIEVKLTPFVDLPEEIYTVRPDTIALDAYTGEPGDTYLWQDGTTTDPVFEVSSWADGIYHVTADNTLCSYSDTSFVFRLIADAGVTKILAPITDCELGDAVQAKIEVTNFGSDTMHIGDTIPVGYRIDEGGIVKEMVILSYNVYPDSSFEYTFTSTSDMSAIKTYSIEAFTELPYDDTITNDTSYSSVEVYGLTYVDLGPDTVVRALVYTIDAGAGNNSYLWQDGSTSQTLLVDTTGEYKVTVTEGSKCENSDSLVVTLIIPDISIERLSNPVNACGLSATENLDIYVINTGTDTLVRGDTIEISYQVNAGILIIDTLIVDRRVEPEDSIMFSSRETIDLSSPGIYQFNMTAIYTKDLVPENNDLDQSVEIFGYPDVSLGPDQVVNTISHTLNAGSGFAAYLWQDGSTEQQFIIDFHNQTPDSSYTVRVTDENGCDNISEVKIGFDIWDISPVSISAPTSACVLSDDEELRVLIRNNGTHTIINEQVKIIASVDGGIPVTLQTTLISPLNPGESLEFLFGISFDFSEEGDHAVRTITEYGKDADSGNDTLEVLVSNYDNPKPDLGGTNDSLGTSLPHVLDAGFDYVSYLWNGIAGSRTYSAEEYGWHLLEVTDSQGCTGRDSVYLMLSDHIADIYLPGNLRVYPIPAKEKLNLEYRSNEIENYMLEIYDPMGRKILIREYKGVDLIYESLDVSGMAEGMYYLVLRSGHRQSLRQIIIR